MADKTYINGIFLKRKQFDNGGDLINASIKVDDFIAELQKHRNEKGYCNVVIQNRKEADKNGNNMYITLDTFTPKNSTEKQSNSLPTYTTSEVIPEQIDDNLPF